jgi:crotonobetainyl-CoA:carnitine CoA-transferase CaiB-like acyl-CoA transferase
VVVEEHWHQLLAAMGRKGLCNDPRFKTNADRVAHVDETHALVGAWTQTFGKMGVFTIAKRHRIPCAPVRDVSEVMHDPHMHERRMLEWIEHDEIADPRRDLAIAFSRRGRSGDRAEPTSSVSTTQTSMVAGLAYRPARSPISQKAALFSAAEKPALAPKGPRAPSRFPPQGSASRGKGRAWSLRRAQIDYNRSKLQQI